MSLENIKSNYVTVNVGGGAKRTLNLAQVLFAVIGSTTSDVYVNEGVTPTLLTIEGDFRNLVAGAGGQGMNSGPLFGVFTAISHSAFQAYVVLNFDQLDRMVDQATLTFAQYGTVAAFTSDLLESIVDVLGGMGHSIQDVGIFKVNKTGNTISPPVQSAATTLATGGTVADGAHFLKVTAINTAGETTGSNEVSITTAGGGLSTITAHWALSAGANGGYNVYVGPTGAESSYFHVAAGVTSLVITALPGTAGTVPVTNTAVDTSLNTQEYINVKSVTHQIPVGTDWNTFFIDGSEVLYVENVQDLVGV